MVMKIMRSRGGIVCLCVMGTGENGVWSAAFTDIPILLRHIQRAQTLFEKSLFILLIQQLTNVYYGACYLV